MITVEPALFFYSLSMMSVSVIRDSVYFERACEDMGHEDCKSLSSEDKKSVQLVVSNFLQWNGLVRQIIPIILAFYIGAWSDKRGRKITLIFGLTGELIYSLLYLCFILNKDFPLSYFIFGVTIPGSIGGATLTTFSSFFSYVSDTSNVNNRTKLMTISSAIYSISAPIGVALGSYILSSSGSHVYVFLVNIFCIMIALVYSIFFLKWQTKPEQRHISEVPLSGLWKDLFESGNLSDSLKTFVNKRPNRSLLWLSISILGLAIFHRGEKSMMFLYTQLNFNWNIHDFSNLRTFENALQVPVLLLLVPFLTNYVKLNDAVVVIIGALGYIVSRIVLMTYSTPMMFYIVAGISSLGTIVNPVARSMVSKIVSSEELGKTFALLALLDSIVPLISSVVFTQTYNLSLETIPGLIFTPLLISNLFILGAALLKLYIKEDVPMKTEDSVTYVKNEEVDDSITV